MAQTNNRHVRVLVLLLTLCATVALAWYASRQWRAFNISAGESWQKEFAPIIAGAAKSVVAIETEQRTVVGLTIKNAGSGFIIDSAGYILTNEHVVHEAESIRITLGDKRRFVAQLVGGDARTDLAVLKIDAANLPASEIVPVDDLTVGQVVIALGNPLGTGSDGKAVCSFGLINRLDQRLSDSPDDRNDRYYDNLIQTSAVTLPGSSGGPLIDEQGRTIGINTAMGAGVQTGRHYGFAIPLNRPIIHKISQLKAGISSHYAFLGIEVAEPDEKTQERLGLKDISGALVSLSLLDSPAQQAGIRSGDVVRTINHEKIFSRNDVISYVNRCRPEQVIEIELLRAIPDQPGRAQEITIATALATRSLRDLRGYQQEARVDSKVIWGMELKTLTAWRRLKMNLDPTQGGVLIYDVMPGSQAERRGIRPGSIIVALGKDKVDNLADFAIVTKMYRFMPHIELLAQRPSLDFFDGR